MENLHQPSQILSDEQIAKIQSVLEQSWDKQTCSPVAREKWSEDNRALGQCAVTSILIAKMFGGEIANNKEHNHTWNILPDGSQHDFTRTQFVENVNLNIDNVTTADDQLNHPKATEAETVKRYDLLSANFNNHWGIAKW